MHDIEHQLRRYGEATERHLLVDDAVAPEARGRHRPRRRLAAAACVAAALAIGLQVSGVEDGTSRLSVGGPSPTPAAPPVPAGGNARPLLSTIRGTATWTGGPDERATLKVAACPAGDEAPACPRMVSTDVAADGSFTLAIPTGTATAWETAAYVTASPVGCVIRCEWRSAQVGPSTMVAADQPPDTLALTVAARVVDVFVRDNRGSPFTGGGVQVSDVRCTATPEECRGEFAPMFISASPTDGSTRVVVDPATRYEFHGQATNTGWPDPTWANDGSTFWFSPSLTIDGRDLIEGHVFVVDGAP